MASATAWCMAERVSPPPTVSPPMFAARSATSRRLAPLHNAPSLDVIDAVSQAMPHVPQFASFDTAFHATLPEAARTYAVPRAWTREWGVRRFGFHGLSHQYCAARAAEILARSDLRLIIAHLGNGASVSAVRGGVSPSTHRWVSLPWKG